MSAQISIFAKRVTPAVDPDINDAIFAKLLEAASECFRLRVVMLTDTFDGTPAHNGTSTERLCLEANFGFNE